MKKQFCPYCGAPLTEGCTCELDAAEEQERFIEEYKSNPMTCEGWAQQDIIDMYRFER